VTGVTESGGPFSRARGGLRLVAGDPVAATIAGLAAALVLATTLAVVTTPDSRPGAVSPGATPVEPWPGVLPVKAASAPDGGVLRVVEHGFSLGPDPRDELVFYGVVVENTSRDRIAFAATATVRLVDAAGAPVKQRFGEAPEVQHKVLAVFPGQRLGIGAREGLDRRDVAGLQVTVDAPTWVPVDQRLQRDPFRATVVRLATLTASVVQVERLGDRLAVSFTASSAYEEAVPAAVTAVFRDRAGRIVGGVVVDEPERCKTFEPGSSRHDRLRIHEHDMPAGIDDGRTEVFLDPFGVNLRHGCGAR
jgi:hypothetical protein